MVNRNVTSITSSILNPNQGFGSSNYQTLRFPIASDIAAVDVYQCAGDDNPCVNQHYS